MIVEILGPTSSGKSTIARSLIDHANSKDGPHFIRAEPAQRSVPKLLWLDLVSLVHFVRALTSVSRCLQLFKIALRRDDKLFMRVNLFRNFVKKQGQIAGLRRQKSDQVTVFDEGSLHAYSNLFSHYTTPLNQHQFTALCGDVLLPDVLISVQTPCETMVKRAQKRADPPWPDLCDAQWLRIFTTTKQAYGILLKKHNTVPIIEIQSENYNITDLYNDLIKLHQSPTR